MAPSWNASRLLFCLSMFNHRREWRRNSLKWNEWKTGWKEWMNGNKHGRNGRRNGNEWRNMDRQRTPDRTPEWPYSLTNPKRQDTPQQRKLNPNLLKNVLRPIIARLWTLGDWYRQETKNDGWVDLVERQTCPAYKLPDKQALWLSIRRWKATRGLPHLPHYGG